MKFILFLEFRYAIKIKILTLNNLFNIFKVNSMCMPFSHDSKVIQDLVKQSFQNNAIYTRWLNCCRDALHCCHNHLINDKPKGLIYWYNIEKVFMMSLIRKLLPCHMGWLDMYWSCRS